MVGKQTTAADANAAATNRPLQIAGRGHNAAAAAADDDGRLAGAHSLWLFSLSPFCTVLFHYCHAASTSARRPSYLERELGIGDNWFEASRKSK